MLRRGNQAIAKFWRRVLLLVVERYRLPKLFRCDAAFSNPAFYCLLKEAGYRCVICFKANAALGPDSLLDGGRYKSKGIHAMRSCPPISMLLVMASFATVATADTLPSIFNGKDLEGWNITDNNDRFKASGGSLVVRSGPDRKGANLWTDKQYGNFVMELEFKMGAGSVDSGVLLRQKSEQIQIGISGSLKRDMTASPYIPGKGYPVEANGVGDLLKVGGWNRMTIVVKGNNYNVWLNGKHVMSYDSETAVEKGPVGLQLHSGRKMVIEYRNIRLAELN